MSARELYRERDAARRARVAERAKARRDSAKLAQVSNRSYSKLLKGVSNERV